MDCYRISVGGRLGVGVDDLLADRQSIRACGKRYALFR
jgi:hypothetical protein